MEYPSVQVASLIARLCDERSFHRNNTKIQKLLYCSYGCFLAAYDKRLCDEYPRAWQYGPVFPRVFNHIHKHRKFPIEFPDVLLPGDQRTFLKNVIDVFGQYDAVPLSEWTHREGSPWHTVVHVINSGELGDFIPDDLIKAYFRENIVKEPGNGHSEN